MDHAPDDAIDQLGLLIDLAEKQQLAVEAASAILKAEREHLAAAGPALAAAVAAAATKGVADGAAQVRGITAEMVSTTQAIETHLRRMAWRLIAWPAGILALVAIAAVAITWGQLTWSRHELAAVQADVQQMQAQQTELERRGRRLIWSTCGKAPCVQVRSGGWTADGKTFAIPATTEDR